MSSGMVSENPGSSWKAAVENYFGYDRKTAGREYIATQSPIAIPPLGAKLVALYLPQFYPIEENDRWWGNGFTEWTNVTRARAQFIDHFQPRLPTELGFYDLRLPEIQEQQVALAKKAGIDAFCFYFYWFGGKTLLEMPVRNFAENPNIDFEFCLCWANDDWSRTWSGNANDILIAQEYSPDDDIAFIAHLSQYLRHAKYLRVDGRPLINVWRATLLPDPKATVQRWRDWCNAHGIGPIHVSCSQTYERLDPAQFGMDSAFQHSPSDTRWLKPNIDSYQSPVEWLNPDYEGQLFDYLDLVRRGRDYRRPEYKVFRSVCPSWDNEARRPGKGRIFVGANPKAYLQYLESTLDEIMRLTPATARDHVFINAWNEWGEGAHLEPDCRYGFGNLEATKMAKLRVALRYSSEPDVERIAIVIHAHCSESVVDSLGWLCSSGLDVPCDIFLTAPGEQATAVQDFLRDNGLSAAFIPTMNRASDAAAFLQVLQSLDYRRHGRLLRLNGSLASLSRLHLSGLANPAPTLPDAATIGAGLILLEQCPEIGLLAASDHLAPIRHDPQCNEAMVRDLAQRMGIAEICAERDRFCASGTFLARTKALLPLGALGIAVDDFDSSPGKDEAATADAIERAIAYSVQSAGLRLAAFDVSDSDAAAGLKDAWRTTDASVRLAAD